MYAVEALNLTKRYKEITAVSSLDLKIEEGELFSLLGVNGAGKTTTVKMLSLLTEPTDGEILFFGEQIGADKCTVKEKLAVSPQETAVAPNLSVWENLDFVCGLYGFSNEVRERKIRDIASMLGLDAVIKRRAGKLSGGWQRRLSIAMALISEPKILFLDEPTLGLDVLARSELWEIIRSLKGRATVVLTTHYMEEAEALSDRIGIMNNGRLLVVGTPRELMDKTGTCKVEDAFVKIVKEASV